MRVVFACFLAVVGSLAQAQVWEKWLAPGLTYRMQIDANVPRVMHVLRFSLGSPVVRAEAELAQKVVYAEDATQGRETVSELAARTGAIASINADFFPFTGDVLGLMVRNGEFVSEPNPKRCAVGWGPADAAFGFGNWSGTASKGGDRIALDGVNREAATAELVANFPAAGFAKGKAGCAMAVIALPGVEPAPNMALRGTVVSIHGDQTKMAVQPDQMVLVGSGAKAPWVASLRFGDTVALDWRTTGFDWSKVRQAVGGGSFLVRGGQVAVDASAQGFNAAFIDRRHPRTAVGLTPKGDLLFAAVDGRQAVSDGATLPEMAVLMRRMGCVEAINLDGGGSTALSLFGLTMNRPSDGAERKVSNAILFYGPHPVAEDGTLRITGATELKVGSSVRLVVRRGDGPPIPNGEVLWSAGGSAWIDQGGRLRPIKGGSTWVRAFVRGIVVEAAYEVPEPTPKTPPGSSVSRR